MKVELLSHTSNIERVLAAAGKTCYSESPTMEISRGLTDDSSEKFLKGIMNSGHHSVLEHATFTFAIEGVSRALLAQITRHRIASFSVQSQRYVNMDHVEYVVPDAIKENPHALRVMEDYLDEVGRTYHDLHAYLTSDYLYSKYSKYVDVVEDNHGNPSAKYFYLTLDSAMNAIKDKPDATTEDRLLYAQYRKDRSAAIKFANENARAVLPNATATNLVMTMNVRELLHFFSLRCCNRAQDEIRELADKMLELCKGVAPSLFEKAGAPCVSGPCPEGKMTCGHPRGNY